MFTQRLYYCNSQIHFSLNEHRITAVEAENRKQPPYICITLLHVINSLLALLLSVSLPLSLSILQVPLTLELLFDTSFISELASVPRRYAQYVPIHQLLYHTLMPLRLKQE